MPEIKMKVVDVFEADKDREESIFFKKPENGYYDINNYFDRLNDLKKMMPTKYIIIAIDLKSPGYMETPVASFTWVYMGISFATWCEGDGVWNVVGETDNGYIRFVFDDHNWRIEGKPKKGDLGNAMCDAVVAEYTKRLK